jgi:hypothetical protein
MSETPKIAAILVADVVGYSRPASVAGAANRWIDPLTVSRASS